MRLLLLLVLVNIFALSSFSQTPKTYSSSEILLQIEKLNAPGSVLYIAAHPDDENTRLLAYLANEKLYRTGYLSLTRGDGGQNLIGDEQGIDLGLIRTQELLAARRIDGAEQFFSRAYDFGYSKSPEEALRIWGHDKILSDVVWVIRKFRPDVIITRFPTTGEGGHGHHTASAILAGEAFDAAADPKQFPEQLRYVSVWQAKRLLWNTFNFGSVNTIKDDQFNIDCGAYNPMLGKGYGEIAAISRSQHKSQGFGVAAQRGTSFEYFATIKGYKPVKDLSDGVKHTADPDFIKIFGRLKEKFSPAAPQNSVGDLQELMKRSIKIYGAESQMTQDISRLIFLCSGIFTEAISARQLNVIGDSMNLQFTFNSRLGVPVEAAHVTVLGAAYNFRDIKPNENNIINTALRIADTTQASQPYWLEKNLSGGVFDISDQQMIGLPESGPLQAVFDVTINGNTYRLSKPVQYKYTDPVKGEIYQPVEIAGAFSITNSPALVIFSNDKKNETANLQYTVQPYVDLKGKLSFLNSYNDHSQVIFDSVVDYRKGELRLVNVQLNSDSFPANSVTSVGGELSSPVISGRQNSTLRKISYDHIPDIYYNYRARSKVIKMDIKTSGTLAGYIAGAGDKIPEALTQLGYSVIMLTEKDITPQNLKKFDVIVTGVRAYNIHDWLNKSYAALMEYVSDGGVLLVQYNTNNSLGPVKARIAPYPFSISRTRITDENAKVNFLLPGHPALNFPNKITEKDFDGWIQERSTYHAENIDSNYQRPLSMKDPGETSQDGSLIIGNYGRGRFIYSGLVFFRELPAGVPGAYRLFANLIANKR